MVRFDHSAASKFAVAAGTLMLNPFNKDSMPDRRRLMFAVGPVIRDGVFRDPGLDVVNLGFEPGRERQGPAEVVVTEMRDGEPTIWRNCRFWTDDPREALPVVSEDARVLFGYDGNSLVTFVSKHETGVEGLEEGVRLARGRLLVAAARVPTDLPTRPFSLTPTR